MRKVVVLPAPVGPSSTANSPSAMSSESPSTAVTVLNCFTTLRSEISAMSRSIMKGRPDRTPRRLVEQRQAVTQEGEADLLARIHRNARRHFHLHPALRHLHGHDLHGAQILAAEDLTAKARGVIEAYMLGPRAEDEI